MSDARKRAEEADPVRRMLRHLCNVYGCTSYGRKADHGPDDCAWCEAEALLAEPAPACGSVSTVRSDDPPAEPLPTCGNCGSNFIVPSPPAPDAVAEAVKWLDLLVPCCEMFHHAKRDQHKGGTPCPIEARYRAWRAALAPEVPR